MSLKIFNFNRQAVMSSLAVAVLTVLLTACNKPAPTIPQDALVRVGNRALTRADLAQVIPAGLSPDDSTKFVKAFITKWVDESLVSEIAAKSVDIDRINRLTDEYRRELILREYTERMFRQHAAELPEDSIKAFYDNNAGLFKLTQPMVRGTYIKIDSAAVNLKKIRRLYASDKADDADLLEKELLSDAIHYDYFRNKWVPWEQIENRIPYDFGVNTYNWPAKGRKLDFTQNGFTYLLYISEILPAGQTTPFEAARPDIVTRMLNANRATYRATLMRELLQQAVSDNRAEVNI